MVSEEERKPRQWIVLERKRKKCFNRSISNAVETLPMGWESPLEEEMATYSSILAWEIPWTEEPGGL